MCCRGDKLVRAAAKVAATVKCHQDLVIFAEVFLAKFTIWLFSPQSRLLNFRKARCSANVTEPFGISSAKR